jgi:uncharacterized protein (UPF0333 family)
MPTKLKGMTSLEIAIIVAIVLIIAVAVGWYLYTTFISSATAEPRLSIVSAEILVSGSTGTLRIIVSNPGPVNVRIHSIEVAGNIMTSFTCTVEGSGSGTLLVVGDRASCEGVVPGISPVPGTMLSGRVILSGGQSFPFNAPVKPTT